MKDLALQMRKLKMEITGSDECSRKEELSVQEHEAEQLAEHGRLMEELSVLQTQMASVKAERAALEMKSAQQQTPYEEGKYVFCFVCHVSLIYEDDYACFKQLIWYWNMDE